MRSIEEFLSFVKRNVPEVYSPEQLPRVRQSHFADMIINYTLYANTTDADSEEYAEELRKQTLTLGKQLGTQGLGTQTRVAYRLMCIYPTAITVIYPVYLLARRLFYVFVGR